MQKISFSTTVHATKEKVWNCLWDIHHYQTWTSVFAEGSTVQTDNWKEGSKIIFGDGKGSGMVSTIAANRPNEFMSFRHLGILKDGVEVTSEENTSSWNGSMENYTLTGDKDSSTLTVEMDTVDEYKDYFMKTWPEAMQKIKGLAEGTVKPVITISAAINAPVERVWESWITPAHIMEWNHASEDWHCPASSNDVRTGGKFSATMAAKDGSFSFDFNGNYDEVKEHEQIDATMSDGRKWKTYFKPDGDKTIVTERFEAESENSLELQQGGWQAILNNFKQYTETL
jgi:uncharacterized protein YndB with AHSA1/START domain